MKNVEGDGERKPHRDDDGTVIAVFANTYSYGRYDALAAVYDWPHDGRSVAPGAALRAHQQAASGTVREP